MPAYSIVSLMYERNENLKKNCTFDTNGYLINRLRSGFDCFSEEGLHLHLAVPFPFLCTLKNYPTSNPTIQVGHSLAILFW